MIGVAVALLVASLAGYLWYLDSRVHRIAVGGLTADPTSGATKNTENVLLVGSTSRCALKQQNAAYGLCSQGVTGVNGDVIMVLHLNPATHGVSIVSIPRDLFVPNARVAGANKVDAGLADSPSQLVAAIRDDFGIPIQHYVELNFDTFANVVDALGGISMYFPEPVYDAYSGLNVHAAGCIHLDGFHALQVVRARHLRYKTAGVTSNRPSSWPQEDQSDLARIRRDHEFLRVLATAVAKQGLGNPLTDERLASEVAPQLTVDRGLSATQLASLALTFHSANLNSAPQLTLPVLESSSSTYFYKGYDYGNIEFPQQPEDQQVINQVLGIGPAVSSTTGKALPPPSAVRVSVLNGTGAYQEGAETIAALKQLGFDTVGVGDAVSNARPSETVVYYASATPAARAAAEAVVKSLTGAVIMAQGPTADGAMVTVVTGSSFSVTSPPSSVAVPHGDQSVAASSVTTKSLPSSTLSSFSAPTPATQGLQPWDPRSCTASGGEGS